MSKHQVYFDHAATTPLRQEVLRRMLPYFEKNYGNPNSLYELGRYAKQAIEKARVQIATAVNCEPTEIVFTTSATEADNLALANNQSGRIIISAVEHKGILTATQTLKSKGADIVVIPVNKKGLLNLDELKEALTAKTVLVSITMADSETGTLQPIREISKIIKNFRPEIVFHTDASQAAAYAEIDVKRLGVDLLTLSAHKLGGPKGVGGLYVKKGTKIMKPHSGTENVPAIVGFGAAMELNEKDKKTEVKKIKKLRDELENGIKKTIPKIILNGHPNKRLPNFLNISFLDIEGEALLLYLDQLGIMASTGSACDAENLKPSTVLTAMGNPYEFVHGSIRFTLGRENTSSDVKYVLEKLPALVAKLRRISPLNLRVI